ncbi:MAG: PHP domain-containing protein [Caldicoprobacterales bacterium]|jgi:predicted metal-dependent phosphoesterase TrpH
MNYTINFNYANMHLHSTHSDGQFSPHHLAVLAKSLGYGGVVLTDHDVISGIPELMRVAKILGIESMPGVEFACKQWDAYFHILGFDFDIDNPELNEFVERLCEYRNNHTRALFEAGLKRGTLSGITWEEVVELNPGCRWFCNDQVRTAMVAKGLVRREEWGAVSKANFKSEYALSVPMEMASVEEAVYNIRNAGGIAVLAHPAGQYEYVDRLVEIGIQGLEVSHPSLSREEEIALRQKAKLNKLYMTGGTDHTGPMGGCMGAHAVPAYHGALEDDYLAIKNRIFS